MSWSPSELAAIDKTHEVVLLMHRAGHDDKRVPVWVVVAGDEVFVRSWGGRESAWFRRAVADADQAIEVGGRTLPVRFDPVEDHAEAGIARGYTSKYGPNGGGYGGAMIAPKAVESTMRLTPR